MIGSVDEVGLLAIRYRIEDVTLDEVTASAMELVRRGVTSEALKRLAAGDVHEREEAQRLLDAACDETGSLPDNDRRVRSFVRAIAADICRGNVSPYDGARRIWAAALVVPDEHAYDAFVYAASEYEDRPSDRRFFEKAILREAEKFTP